MIKFFLVLAWIALVLGAILVPASYLVENYYRSRAVLGQRVELDQASLELLGEPGNLIGSPELFVIDDPKAFLPNVKGPKDSLLISEAYLREHQIYPLQLITVEFFSSIARLGGGIATILGLIGVLWIKAKRKGPNR